MNKQKIKEIVKFYIQKNIQNKWFILVNILIFLSVLIATNGNNIKSYLESKNINLFDDEFKIEIIDEDNLATDQIIKQFENRENIEISKISENNYTKENIPKNFALVEISKSETGYISAQITSKEGIDNEIYSKIVEAIKEARNEIFAEKSGITNEEIDMLSEYPQIDRIFLGANAENSGQKESIKLVSTIIVYLVSIFIFSKIANEIAQEKVSKSIEYVLTSVTAEEYLLAKIISVMAIVLIQVIYTIIYYLIGNMIGNLIIFSKTGESISLLTGQSIANMDKDIVEYIILVFVYAFLNLILMSIIQAALSSKTTSMSEAGNSVMFLMVITVAAYLMTIALITPYTNMTIGLYALSCIPLLSNYFVPAIVIIGQANAFQIIISFLLLIISIPIVFKICSKILKNGVLDYSNKKAKKQEKTLEDEQKILMNKMKFKQFSFVIGMTVIIWVTVQVIMQVLMSMIIAPLVNISEGKMQLLTLACTSILSLLASIGFLNIYSNDKNSKKDNIKIDNKTKLKYFGIGLVLIIVLQGILAYVYQKIGLNYNAIETIDLRGDFSFISIVLYICTIALIPAVFEELFFRKELINYSEKFGKGFAVIFSALVFGLVHMNLGQFIFSFGIGIVFGIIYLKTKDIKLTMILHFLNNSYSAILSILVMKNFVNEQLLEGVLNLLFAVSLAILILRLLKFFKQNKEKLKLIKIKDLQKNLKEYKYILYDYTFIVSIVLIIVCFALTEKMLRSL